VSRRNGINRAFSWIKKVLEITEVSTVPELVLPEVRPTLEVFGWERRSETEANSADATENTIVTLALQPEDVARLVTAVSIEHLDITAVHTVWLTLQRGAAGSLIGIIRPAEIPISSISIPLGTSVPFLMLPGDRLSGHCDPTTPAGVVLRIKSRFIDIDLGEYIAPL